VKQENRFVAQLFHYLAPFVDMERPLFICVDGAAAMKHSSGAGASLADPNVPDLWLAFCGHSEHTGIEAKILDKGAISIRQGQLVAWRSSGNGAYRPRFWVATNRDISKFSCWQHTSMVRRLDSTASTVANVSLSLAEYPADHISKSIAELALYILTHHQSAR
jgi:hypothetical protein